MICLQLLKIPELNSMGGASSSPSAAAAKAKASANELLTLFFTQADLKELLELHSLDKCSLFVMGISDEIQKKLKKLPLAPGKELTYAPTSSLVPGKETNSATLNSKRKRDTSCADLGYYHVRHFQIYAALALSTLETEFPAASAFSAKRGGGSSSFTGRYIELLKNISNTPFKALLNYISPDKTGMDGFYLKFDDRVPRQGDFVIRWNFGAGSQTDMSIEGEYVYRNTSDTRKFTIQMTRTDEMTVVMTIEGGNTPLTQTFRFAGNSWRLADKDDVTFYNNIHAIFADSSSYGPYGPYGQGQGQSQSQGPYGQRQGPYGQGPYGQGPYGQGPAYSASTSALGYEGFVKLKEIFEKRSKGLKKFPVAYAIGRLRTLIDPMGEAYRTHICEPASQKLYFEDDRLLPKPGDVLGNNIYMRSLISLYYDNYQIDGSGKVFFTQSDSAKSDMAYASMMFAGLNGVLESDPRSHSFLEKGAMKDHRACINAGGRTLTIRNDAAKIIIDTVFKPMIALQTAHTQKVNALLSKMFKIVTDGGVKKIQLLNTRGIEGVNAFGVEARSLLLEYYLGAEALYRKGTEFFFHNAGSLT